MDTFVQRKDRTIRLRIKKRRTEIEQSRANKKYNPAKISKRATGLSGYHIYAPEKLSIYEIENDKEIFEATLNFIEEIKNNFCKKTTIIDFRDTKRVTAAALILIYATLETCATEGYIKSSILYPENSPATRRLLRAKNIHRLIQNQNIEYDFKSVELLPVISGVGNSHFDDIIDYIQKKIFKNNMSDQTEYYYSDAVSEAINNVGRHAYPSLSNDKRKWWLTCSVIENQLYLAIYDAGVGIPTTVIQKDWFLSSLKSSFPEEYKNLILASPELSGVKEKIMPFLPVSIAKDHQLIFFGVSGGCIRHKIR